MGIYRPCSVPIMRWCRRMCTSRMPLNNRSPSLLLFIRKNNNMKHLIHYINEAVASKGIMFTVDDLIDHGVWVPNDDLSKKDYQDILDAFHNFRIDGHDIRCVMDDGDIKFICFVDDKQDKKLISIIRKMVNILINTIYSIEGDDDSIMNLIKHIK
jgi:hypothetical protein